MTPQEIFDTVATHLLTQNRMSHNGITCLYRGPNGTKCAAGVLIPEKDYSISMEMREIAAIARRFPLPAFIRQNLSLISALQRIHDNAWTNDDGTFRRDVLIERLRGMASHFNLDASKLPTE